VNDRQGYFVITAFDSYKKAFLCYLLYRRQMPTIVVFWGSEHAFGGTCGPGEHVSGPVHPPQSDMRETSSSAEGR